METGSEAERATGQPGRPSDRQEQKAGRQGGLKLNQNVECVRERMERNAKPSKRAESRFGESIQRQKGQRKISTAAETEEREGARGYAKQTQARTCLYTPFLSRWRANACVRAKAAMCKPSLCESVRKAVGRSILFWLMTRCILVLRRLFLALHSKVAAHLKCRISTARIIVPEESEPCACTRRKVFFV